MYFSFAFKQGCVGCGLELHLDLRSHDNYLAEVGVKFSTLGGDSKDFKQNRCVFSSKVGFKEV